jgi:hypothetical protein
VVTSNWQWFPLGYGVVQTSWSWPVSCCSGTLKGVAADVIQGEGPWVLRRTSTMRVNIRFLVCDF